LQRGPAFFGKQKVFNRLFLPTGCSQRKSQLLAVFGTASTQSTQKFEILDSCIVTVSRKVKFSPL